MYLLIQKQFAHDEGAFSTMLVEIAKKASRGKGKMLQAVHDALAEKNACYVLITCGVPTEDGKMEVEMTYEGDASLAAFLIESAQDIIETDDMS